MRNKNTKIPVRKNKSEKNIFPDLKIKIPSFLPLALVTTTYYCKSAIYLFQKMKELPSGTSEHKAVIRIYRRTLTEQQKEIRERNKAISQLLIIKAVLKDKTFFESSDIEALKLYCDYTDKKTFLKNLKVLESLEMISEASGKYFIAGWEKIGLKFKHKEKHIRFKFVKHGNRLETKLTRIALEQKEQQCKQAATLQLNKCTELKDEVMRITGKGTLSALELVQDSITKNPALAKSFDIDSYILFKVCRGNVSLSYRFWSCLLGYKSIGGFAQVKRKLQKAGLIAVQKQAEEIPDKNRIRYANRSNCIGTMIFDRNTNRLMLHKPDLLIFLSLN